MSSDTSGRFCPVYVAYNAFRRLPVRHSNLGTTELRIEVVHLRRIVTRLSRYFTWEKMTMPSSLESKFVDLQEVAQYIKPPA